MSNDEFQGPEPFACQQSVFGAFDSDSGRLVLIVEAGSEVEALARVDSVAPLLGVKGVCELLVVQLDEMPTGIPTFLMSFFKAGGIGFNRGNVAPGSSTLQ